MASMTETDDGSETTQIRVSKAQRDELHDMKAPGESYKDVVARLLDSGENGQHNS